MSDSQEKIKKGMEKTKEGLPWQAFAIVRDKSDPSTWKLPHHTRSIYRWLQGKIDLEKTVDWQRMPAAVAGLSEGGYRGQRVEASREEIREAARHLAAHYRHADKEVPSTLEELL